MKTDNKIPECLLYRDYDRDCDCEYENMTHECDHCICLTSLYFDFSGIDPRTDKPFMIDNKIIK